MKSKATELKPNTADKQTANNHDFLDDHVNEPFNFVGLYKSAAETSKILVKDKPAESLNKGITTNKAGIGKRERSPNKNKRKNKQELLEMSQINIDASSLISGRGASARLNNSKVTSTPNASAKKQAGVKSIMKNTSLTDQLVDSPRSTTSSGKPKKRNKSVSFMLDDNEEVVIKRTKSDDSVKVNKKAENVKANPKDKKKPFKKPKKDQQSEKENTEINSNKQNMDVESTSDAVPERRPAKVPKGKQIAEPAPPTITDGETQNKKRKFKKAKKQKPEANPDSVECERNNNEVTNEAKSKRPKKKKQSKPAGAEKTEAGEGDGEPAAKSRKRDPKPDLVEDLENLSIGDNTHTLTNLLDEMTVVDKNKKKKLRQKFSKNKKPKGPNKEEGDKPEVKEKEKWKKRKWNKGRKGDLDGEALATTVVVENLPLGILLDYKKLLTEHFVKYGLIKKIGIAEVYPTEDSKPVFTTTVSFYSDGAAEQALGDNNTQFEGSRIRVNRPLPATDTTVAVRCYAELSDQNISSAFLPAGKIRSIRHLAKGKKAMATAFVEFHKPDSVERAIKMAADTKIGGRKIHVAKFEPRTKKNQDKKPKNDGDSAADADSEDSND